MIYYILVQKNCKIKSELPCSASDRKDLIMTKTRKPMNKNLKIAVEYLAIILTAVLLALNYQLFVVENNFAPAGINGVATMIQYKTGFSIGYMSLLINIPLCIFAFFFINRPFAKRSLCFCLVYSFVFLYLQKLGLENLQYNANGQDTIFPALLSGIISGFVYGMLSRFNSSAGGTLIISKYINKTKPSLNFFWVNFVLNAIVAVVSFFVYAKVGENGVLTFDYRPVCLCVTYCFVSSFIADYIIKGTKSAYRFTIITPHGDEITADIFKKLKHGVTRIEATGSYSNTDLDMLVCVVNKHQLIDFREILKQYDNTFSFSEQVVSTYGNFATIKKIGGEPVKQIR